MQIYAHRRNFDFFKELYKRIRYHIKFSGWLLFPITFLRDIEDTTHFNNPFRFIFRNRKKVLFCIPDIPRNSLCSSQASNIQQLSCVRLHSWIPFIFIEKWVSLEILGLFAFVHRSIPACNCLYLYRFQFGF